jgi:hypothetical protein
VSIGTGEVYAYINHVRDNRTTTLYYEEYLNATLNTGTGNIRLWYNDTLINQGVSPLANLTNFTQVAVINVSATYSGNQNYTGELYRGYRNLVGECNRYC